MTEQVILNRGLAKMLQGGVIMDVVNSDQARIAEQAGACAVMALERIPSDIRAAGGVARMSQVELVEEIQNAVSIPVMAKVRIGHEIEARMLEALEVDYIDESEVLTPADELCHIDKASFKIPFVCGARNLGEAMRRIAEGASMLRTKGEAGTGNIVEAVRHARAINSELRTLLSMPKSEQHVFAKQHSLPWNVVEATLAAGRLPVVNFAAGGIATPADAALMMHLGVDGVFVGSGIFKSSAPEKLAVAMVTAVTHYQDYDKLVECSRGLGAAMPGIDIRTMPEHEKMADRTEEA